MSGKAREHPGGFSLLELVLVIAITGMIAAIAIPRLSRAVAGASESSLCGSLAVLRKAIDFYATEHGGTLPTEADIESQLLMYSDAQGNTQAARDATHIYGPYLASLPTLPVGENKGNTRIAKKDDKKDKKDKKDSETDGDGVGWIYKQSTGKIHANTKNGEKDDAGVKYKDY